MCKRHVGIHYRYPEFSALYGCDGAVYGSAQGHIAVSIGKGYLHQGGSKLDHAAAVQRLALTKMYGQVIRISGVHVGTHVGAYEEALLSENAFIFGLRVRCGALGMEMVELQVSDIARVRTAAERLDKDMRHACNAAQVNVAMGFNMAYCLVGGNKSGWIHRSKILY